MFPKVGWVVTWLAAPLAVIAAVGLSNAIGEGDVHLTDVLSATVVVLWICLVWAVARVNAGRVRMTYLAGCVILTAAYLGLSAMPRQPAKTTSSDVVSVTLIKPQKPK